ncbi:hypothetical protein SAMN05216303_1032 [Rhodoferax sp. OV413]|uniref:hypothetical protein n=1 Tax=Rhodoferax sp. OV413 TaxID=1855285 RepID=UPI000885418E|nr:hypothetical protein [Rhodoferax sp. OV413]SDP08060.1 hypothetical protein SAMN05216303_1032 [Rhodoferax sp. OV413]
MRRLALAVFSSLLVALAGCAITPGMSRDEVLSSWGRPTAELDRNGIHRLQYSRQPMGQSVVMVDLDANGRVVQSREVLQPSEFAKVDLSGSTTRADILWAFGPPAKVDGVMSWTGDIWSYRWRDTEDMWFWVYFDPAGMVRRVQQGPDIAIRPFPR